MFNIQPRQVQKKKFYKISYLAPISQICLSKKFAKYVFMGKYFFCCYHHNRKQKGFSHTLCIKRCGGLNNRLTILFSIFLQFNKLIRCLEHFQLQSIIEKHEFHMFSIISKLYSMLRMNLLSFLRLFDACLFHYTTIFSPSCLPPRTLAIKNCVPYWALLFLFQTSTLLSKLKS